MVILVDILFLIGNIPNSIVFVFSQYVDTSSLFYLTISGVGNIILFAAAGCDIFIYSATNTLYKKILNKSFRFCSQTDATPVASPAASN